MSGRNADLRNTDQLSDDSGYYGQPVIHRSHWGGLIVAYFWFGGIAGGAQALSGIAGLVGAWRIQRLSRYVALTALLPCPPLLILDLGRPERFLNMLRVLKLRSPMSVGTWGLMASSALITAAAAAQAKDDGLLPNHWPVTSTGRGRVVDALSIPAGLLLASYTGVLLAATAVPLWTRRATLIGPLFASSAMSTAAAAVALASHSGRGSHRDEAGLARFEQTAALVESGLLFAWMASLGRAGKALEEPPLRGLVRHGVAGAGIAAPLALNALAHGRRGRGGRTLTIAASVLTLAGGLMLRHAVVHGGNRSADDPGATFAITRKR